MKIVIRTLLVALVCLFVTETAQAQLFKKRERKPNAKEQLAIERQRNDSLVNLLEEYRLREQEWQKAWYDQKQEKQQEPQRKVFKVDYTPAAADSLAQELKLQQVDDALENFFMDYVCEPETFVSDTSLDSLYTARLNDLVSPIHLPYNELVRSYIKRYTDSSGLMSRVLS